MGAAEFNYEKEISRIIRWGWGDAVASVPAGYKFWMVNVFDRKFYPHTGGQEYIAMPVGTQPFAWGEIVYGWGEDDRAREYWKHGVLLYDEECGWRRPHYRQSPSGVWYHLNFYEFEKGRLISSRKISRYGEIFPDIEAARAAAMEEARKEFWFDDLDGCPVEITEKVVDGAIHIRKFQEILDSSFTLRITVEEDTEPYYTLV